MDYIEAREYVKDAAKKGSVLGLENMKRLMKELDNVQDKIKTVHIAGTNGKGSTLAYISEILKKAGYKVGKYTSPAVFDYREMFLVNSEYISKGMYAKCIEKIKKAIDKMKSEGLETPTAFEIETALAFLCFYEEKCDIALIETGMGGDLDATNVINNTLLSIIAPISLDHMQFLGDSIGEIARHKSGIIKKNSAVVIASQTNEANSVIKEYAKKQKALVINCKNAYNIRFWEDKTTFDYTLSSEKTMCNITTKMLGDFQPENIVTAIETVDYLRKKGFEISDENILMGINDAIWHGRFEKISENPLIYFDGGHNPAAAKHIKKSLEIYFTNRKIVYIIGVLADKDYNSVLKITGAFADKIITITPNNARALSGEELRIIADRYNNNTECAESVEDAICKASLYIKDEDGVIIVFGSLSYLREVKEIIKNKLL